MQFHPEADQEYGDPGNKDDSSRDSSGECAKLLAESSKEPYQEERENKSARQHAQADNHQLVEMQGH